MLLLTAMDREIKNCSFTPRAWSQIATAQPLSMSLQTAQKVMANHF